MGDYQGRATDPFGICSDSFDVRAAKGIAFGKRANLGIVAPPRTRSVGAYQPTGVVSGS